MNDKIQLIAEYVLSGQPVDRHQALTLISQSSKDPYDLLYWANRIRQQFFGNTVKLCSIIPARLGGCSQDCAFCAQSARHQTNFKAAQYLTDDEILEAVKITVENKIPSFGIVYSGKTIDEKELERLETLIGKIKSKYKITLCGGFGIINQEQAKRLKRAGLDRYNHNLETSANHFSRIVSTHSFKDRLETIKAVKDAGFGVCAGGIFGIGESWEDRIDMAILLRSLQADMIPVNFLHPIEGTPMANQPKLIAFEILQIIAVYRFIMPNQHIKVAGGRVLNLGDMQSWIFYAGATAILTGNYLTTAGRTVEQDIDMVEKLGLKPELV